MRPGRSQNRTPVREPAGPAHEIRPVLLETLSSGHTNHSCTHDEASISTRDYGCPGSSGTPNPLRLAFASARAPSATSRTPIPARDSSVLFTSLGG